MNVVPMVIAPCSWRSGGFDPPTGTGQSPGGGPEGKAPGSSRDPTVYISQKMPKAHPRGPFHKLLFHKFC